MKKATLLSLFILLKVFVFAQFRVAYKEYIPNEVGVKSGNKALCDTNITYSDGIYANSIGPVAVQSWEAGIYFDTVQTKFFGDTTYIEAIQYYIRDTTVINGVRIRMYEGTTISAEALGSTITNGTLIFDSTISNSNINQDAFTSTRLDSSYLIKKGVGYSIFIEIIQTTNGNPMAVSAGPMALGRGGWISLGGYQQLPEAASSLDFNWMINACVRGDIIIPEYNIELEGGVFNPTGYEKMPFDQIESTGYSFESRVKNLGVDTATNVTSVLKIDDIEKETLMHGTILPDNSNTQVTTNIILDSTVGVHNVRMDCFMDSTDFDPSDNKYFGEYEITENVYSRNSETSFFITGSFLAGNAYSFINETVITQSMVSVINNEDYIIPADYPMFVALFNVDKSTGLVDGNPLAMSDTIYADDTLQVNAVYDFNFNFKYPLPVFEGQTILAAFNNPTSGIRRFDDPPVYETNTCFSTGPITPDDSIFDFQENPGHYYIVDLMLDRTIFGVSENNGLPSNITIYPNPSSDIVTISNLEKVEGIKMIDITGRVVYSKNKNINLTESIDVSNIEKGMYFVVIKGDDNAVYQEKLIIH